jgi:hypothetical protein
MNAPPFFRTAHRKTALPPHGAFILYAPRRDYRDEVTKISIPALLRFGAPDGTIIAAQNAAPAGI